MSKKQIKKVLIANRAEIALRILRTCQKMGIKAVGIVSEADLNQSFARKFDELVVVGKAAAADSYLNIERIVKAALERGCDAVHPGYGFLSENEDFARAVESAGLIFIGPTPETIESMGSKTRAREMVSKSDVPCVPGVNEGLPDGELIKIANKIGYPVLIKAAMGGGGRGMRVANSEKELAEFLPRARAEALKYFSDETVFLEKYITKPRHVEVQVFGDMHGNVVHFGTRECSAQRRHQKVVEEAPAPFLNDKLRAKIHDAAVSAAKCVNYRGAGTVEFIVSGEEFYFLEMNTRIQVEHPVTEEVFGLDLIELQIKVAQGEKLPLQQAEIMPNGHAMEFRIYAEDPAKGFAPAIGRLQKLQRPRGDYIREDSGFEEGDEISPYYDAMISKLIVRGKNRAECISWGKKALAQYRVEGLATTLPLHRWLITFTEFSTKFIDVTFLEREFTPAVVEAFRAAEVLDPSYKAGLGGLERVEYLRSGEYTIEIKHHHDGYFLATPVSGGKRAGQQYQRASNSLKLLLRVLQEEVLDVKTPKEIFAN